MTLLWVVPLLLAGPHPAQNISAPNVVVPKNRDQQINDIGSDPVFEVRALSVSENVAEQTTTFANGVVAVYGVTTIHSDRLVVVRLLGSEHATATGHVKLDDPDGQVTADSLDLNLKGVRRGSATNVFATIAGARITAAKADLTPTLWTFYDVTLTTCRNKVPLYSVRSRKLTLIPGKRGKAENPRLSLFGHQLLTLPTQNFNLDRRSEGLRPPSFSYQRDRGLGIAWVSGILLDDRTGVGGAFATFPKSLPGYSLQVSRTWIPADLSQGLIAPRSEFSERYGYGYLDSIENASPETEAGTVRAPRKSLSLGSSWNQSTSRGSAGEFFSKAVELSAERGGDLGSAGFISQMRLQTIRQQGGPWITRGVLTGSIGSPLAHFTGNLVGWARVDGESYLGPKTSGWLHGTVGIAYNPVKQLRLSAGYVTGRDFGTSQFDIDRLGIGFGFNVRADLDLGPTKISFLTKHDGKLGWWDREYSVSQVVGCLEPFVTYRKSPADYRIGLKIRIDQFVDVLQSRDFKRKSPEIGGNPRQVISDKAR